MSPRGFASTLLLPLVLTVCGPSPHAPETVSKESSAQAEETPPGAEVGLDDALSDPFLGGLVSGLGDRGGAARLDVGLRAARLKAREGRTGDVRIALAEALDILAGYPVDPGDPDDAIVLAALELVLLDLAATTRPKGDPR